MKASSSQTSEDDEAKKKKEEPLVFDYQDFFSVLMYYYGMNKEEILNHSRAFLHGLFRMRLNRALENLGATEKSEEESQEDDETSENISLPAFELSKSDYPTEFTKLPPKPNKSIESSPEKTRDFLASFAGAEVFKNVMIAEDQ